jgi:hypothetical protein
MDLEFVFVLSRQPLFRLLAAFIVLLVADAHPVSGLAAAFVWFVWVWMGRRDRGGRRAII